MREWKKGEVGNQDEKNAKVVKYRLRVRAEGENPQLLLYCLMAWTVKKRFSTKKMTIFFINISKGYEIRCEVIQTIPLCIVCGKVVSEHNNYSKLIVRKDIKSQSFYSNNKKDYYDKKILLTILSREQAQQEDVCPNILQQ